jgi:hypothetical protein
MDPLAREGPFAVPAIEIPTLDPAMQATEPPDRWVKWGTISRNSRLGPRAGYHFYTQDYKFALVWPERGERVISSGVGCAVEVNYSTQPGMPTALALADVYRKRALARRWQAAGVRVVADLNVEPHLRGLNFLGIPRGWRAYAVRSQRGIDLGTIEDDYRASCQRAGTTDLLFLVFGGWRSARDLCQGRGWTWVPEDLHAARGETIHG